MGVVSTTADETGAYRFPALSPGPYEIVATLQGFKPSATKVTVVVGQQLQADLNLAVGGLTETVSVTALATSIDTKQSGAATNIQAETIALLPKGRDFQSLVTLAPGANSESRSGGISVDGASAAENKFYVDGVDATNLRTGVAATTFNTDFIEEVQIKSSGHAAEFGGATGGVISVISRSGTNNFSGSVGTYFNSEALNGNLALNNSAGTGGASPGTGLALPVASGTRRELRLLLNGVNEAETVEYPKDDYSHWEPAFQVGGPIVKNKLWFWGGYAPLIGQHQPHRDLPLERSDRHLHLEGNDADLRRQHFVADPDAAAPARRGPGSAIHTGGPPAAAQRHEQPLDSVPRAGARDQEPHDHDQP